jgi:hypothetical protein
MIQIRAIALVAISFGSLVMAAEPPARKTVVGIEGASFLVNGQPTYKGRVYIGVRAIAYTTP